MSGERKALIVAVDEYEQEGLQDLLVTSRRISPGPIAKGEMLVNGPGTLIVGGRKPPVILPGKVSSRPH